ncbi:MAG TPA: energy transducer TonB [Candidatus Eisenbacteria bacterium]|nr:energy transducer TonB [Candidatus Eisenbacteria bacterium]
MTHGVEAYFVERRRTQRRVSVLAASLAVAILSPIVATNLPLFRRPVRDLVDQTARFGYEGPDQFVRRINFQQVQGTSAATREMGAIDTKHARPGGAVRGRRTHHPNAPPEVRKNVVGPGTADADMMERAVSRLANVPVVQSEDLIIVYASTPEYPLIESVRGVEGKVMVQALVDTTGRVVDVQLLASTGVASFERSVSEAVWQYRFRPYRVADTPREVYAILRFAFRIY